MANPLPLLALKNVHYYGVPPPPPPFISSKKLYAKNEHYKKFRVTEAVKGK